MPQTYAQGKNLVVHLLVEELTHNMVAAAKPAVSIGA
jgi:hypothetical protein